MAILIGDESSSKSLTIEQIASRLSYFYEQIHLLHWQTTSIAEHQSLGSLYEKLVDFKDEIIEKLMGYMSKRPSAFKIEPLVNYSQGVPQKMVKALATFATQLESWAEEQEYCDVEQIAQTLNGEANKTLYLLTLS